MRERRGPGEHLAAAQRGHVLEEVDALLAEAGGLDGGGLEVPVDVVVHEHLERGAVDLLGDDHERGRVPHDPLEHRHQRADIGDLLGGEEDVGVVEHGEHRARVGDQVGRDVAVVELEVLDEVHVQADQRPVVDGDDAVVAHGVQGLRHHAADRVVVVGRDRGDPGERVHVVHRVRDRGEVRDHARHGGVDPALDQHRVAALADGLQALADDRLGEHGRGRGAVADHVVRLDGGFLEHLGAHVLELVAQVDLPRDRHTVVGDLRRTGDLLEDDVAPLRARAWT